MLPKFSHLHLLIFYLHSKKSVCIVHYLILVTLVEKQKSKVIKQAKKLLQREGLLPLDELLVS